MTGAELRMDAAASPRVLIVGEDPGRGDPGLPLYPLPDGCAGARLRALTGMGATEYLHRTDRINLFRVARPWSAPAARERALDLAPLLPYRVVVALGRRVTAALLSLDEPGGADPNAAPWYEPISIELPLARGPRCVVIPHPHPSGRSRVFNTNVAQDESRLFWRRLLATDLSQVARDLVEHQLLGLHVAPTLGSPAIEIDHELKTWTTHFDAIWVDRKNLELRPDDRGFEVGHVLHLREWDPSSRAYGRRSILVRVTHVLRDAPEFGLSTGFCALSIRVLSRHTGAGDLARTDESAPVLDRVATSRV